MWLIRWFRTAMKIQNGILLRSCPAIWLLMCLTAAAQESGRPDGLYAEIRTSKGLIAARLEADLTPMTVANFVGLAEGTIANSAFDPGRPFFDGAVYHRVVPGHVIQTGIPPSDRAKGPGYTFPNEIHARLSHNRAGMLNMANSGPNTNSSQFCITLGDRSYLDGDYTVFGEVVDGLNVVMRIVQGDVVESVRIVRVGPKAQAFHPTTESFQALVRSAEQRVAENAKKKAAAEQEWIARNYPMAAGPDGGVLTEQLARQPLPLVTAQKAAGPSTAGQFGDTPKSAIRVRYRGRQLRYAGDVIGREGPALEVMPFGSGDDGAPGFVDPPAAFTVEQGKPKINPGLDGAIAGMSPGERRVVIVPAALAYGRAGHYAPDIPGKRRLVISPNAMLVYEVEVLPNE
jgi:peptidylprolyl isomerase